VPCEYIVNLPIAKKFARDKTYEEMYWRGTNGATFEDVIHSLIPFRETRKMVLGVQEKINVPLHHVQLTAKHHGLFKAEFVPLN
jgi:hypothetical protein